MLQGIPLSWQIKIFYQVEKQKKRKTQLLIEKGLANDCLLLRV